MCFLVNKRPKERKVIFKNSYQIGPNNFYLIVKISYKEKLKGNFKIKNKMHETY